MPHTPGGARESKKTNIPMIKMWGRWRAGGRLGAKKRVLRRAAEEDLRCRSATVFETAPPLIVQAPAKRTGRTAVCGRWQRQHFGQARKTSTREENSFFRKKVPGFLGYWGDGTCLQVSEGGGLVRRNKLMPMRCLRREGIEDIQQGKKIKGSISRRAGATEIGCRFRQTLQGDPSGTAHQQEKG